MTPPDDQLKPWKDQPPKTPDETAAANLLQEIRSMPSLSPEALARVERRVRENAHRRASQRLPLFAGLRPAVLAGALGLALVVGGLTMFAVDHRTSRLAPSDSAVAMGSAPVRDAAGSPASGSASKGFAGFGTAPPAAPAAQLASREWSRPPPDVAGSFDSPGAGGSYGARGAVGHGFAEKAKKSAPSNAFRGHEQGLASEPARRGEPGGVELGADLDDKASGAVASASAEDRGSQRMRSAEGASPSAKAELSGVETARKAAGPAATMGFARPPPAGESADVEAQFAAAPAAKSDAPAAAPAKTLAAPPALPAPAPPNDALQVQRGEQLAREGRCPEAIIALSPTADREGTDPLVERALFGRAGCRLSLGQSAGAREDLETYLSRFPAGRFVPQVRSLLR